MIGPVVCQAASVGGNVGAADIAARGPLSAAVAVAALEYAERSDDANDLVRSSLPAFGSGELAVGLLLVRRSVNLHVVQPAERHEIVK